MRSFYFLLCAALCVMGLTGCAGKENENVTITEENIIKEVITIDGVLGEYDLLFLTDTHMVVNSSEDSEQIAANAAERAPQFVEKEKEKKR